MKTPLRRSRSARKGKRLSKRAVKRRTSRRKAPKRQSSAKKHRSSAKKHRSSAKKHRSSSQKHRSSASRDVWDKRWSNAASEEQRRMEVKRKAKEIDTYAKLVCRLQTTTDKKEARVLGEKSAKLATSILGRAPRAALSRIYNFALRNVN